MSCYKGLGTGGVSVREGTFSCHLQCGCLPSACVSFQNLVRSRSSCETVTEGSQSPSDCDRESIPVDEDPVSELVDGKNVQHVRLLEHGAPLLTLKLTTQMRMKAGPKQCGVPKTITAA